MQPPAAFHHGAIAQPAGDRFRGQRGRHHHQFQFRPDGLLHAADHGQGQVAVEAPLVELIEHDRGHRFQERVVLQHAEEDAFGDDPDPRLRTHAAIEADLVADLVAQRRAAFVSDPPRTGPGRQAAGLQDHDRTGPGQARIEQGRRHAGRLARPGGRPQHDRLRNCARAATICGKTSSIGKGAGIGRTGRRRTWRNSVARIADPSTISRRIRFQTDQQSVLRPNAEVMHRPTLLLDRDA